MAASRSGTLAYLVPVGALVLGVTGMLWGLFDTLFVGELIARAEWQTNEQVLSMSREYVLKTWQWLPLIVVLRLGLQALVTSRLTGTTTRIVGGTIALFVAHLLVISWAYWFPQIIGEYYGVAQSTSQVSQAGFMTAVDLAWEWGVGYAPALLVVGSDLWYLSSPIRNDALRR